MTAKRRKKMSTGWAAGAVRPRVVPRLYYFRI